MRAYRLLIRELSLLLATLADPRKYLFPKLAVCVGLGYLFVPLDIIPDRLPLIGHLDEATFVVGGFVLARVFGETDAPDERFQRARYRVFRLLGYRRWWLAHAHIVRPRSAIRGLVVVGGAARSGTTMLRTVLGRHPQVASGPETTVLLRRITAPRHLGPRLRRDAAEIEQWQFESQSQIEFVEHFHRAALRESGRSVWVEKTPANVFRFGFVKRHFPNARLVHIVRDGRDAACSLRCQPWAKIAGDVPRDSPEAARRCGMMWAASVRAGIRHRGHPRYFELRYEELVARPAETLLPLLTFLDLPWDERLLATDMSLPRPSPLAAYSDDFRDAVQLSLERDARVASHSIFDVSVGRWRRDLSPEDIEALAPVVGNLLIALGYEHDHRWASDPLASQPVPLPSALRHELATRIEA
jgi:uncharacterized membrane protein YkvA (DUF1232 family)